MAKSVLLIDQNGANRGVMATAQALIIAKNAGLDLLEMGGDKVPPVVKILDYGKWKYEQKKKANEAKKNQKVVEIRELQFRPIIEQHDFMVKMKKVKEFIESGDKVKITVRGRGVDMRNKEKVMEIFSKVLTEMADSIMVEKQPASEGRNVNMMIAPAKK